MLNEIYCAGCGGLEHAIAPAAGREAPRVVPLLDTKLSGVSPAAMCQQSLHLLQIEGLKMSEIERQDPGAPIERGPSGEWLRAAKSKGSEPPTLVPAALAESSYIVALRTPVPGSEVNPWTVQTFFHHRTLEGAAVHFAKIATPAEGHVSGQLFNTQKDDAGSETVDRNCKIPLMLLSSNRLVAVFSVKTPADEISILMAEGARKPSSNP